MAPRTWWQGWLAGPHLAPDGGHPVLVAEQGVHVHAVLDDQGRDGDQGQDLGCS